MRATGKGRVRRRCRETPCHPSSRLLPLEHYCARLKWRSGRLCQGETGFGASLHQLAFPYFHPPRGPGCVFFGHCPSLGGVLGPSAFGLLHLLRPPHCFPLSHRPRLQPASLLLRLPPPLPSNLLRPFPLPSLQQLSPRDAWKITDLSEGRHFLHHSTCTLSTRKQILNKYFWNVWKGTFHLDSVLNTTGDEKRVYVSVIKLKNLTKLWEIP